MNCLHSLKRRYTRSPTLHIKERIETVELEIAEESLAAYSVYESRLIQDFATSNQSKIYKHIRNLTKAGLIPSTVSYNGDNATNDIHKHHCLILFFFSMFTTSDTSVPLCNESLDTNTHHHLVSIELSENDTCCALVSLDPYKATGIDYPKSSKTVHPSYTV